MAAVLFLIYDPDRDIIVAHSRVIFLLLQFIQRYHITVVGVEITGGINGDVLQPRMQCIIGLEQRLYGILVSLVHTEIVLAVFRIQRLEYGGIVEHII